MLECEVIADEIRRALEDAAIPEELVEVLVHASAHAPPSPPSGHFGPGQRATADDKLALNLESADLKRLNADGARGRHRIVIYAGYAPAGLERWVLAGLLRHELEHARQWEALGDVPFRLSALVDEIHYARFADAPEEKFLYRAKPDEQDANAAASSYLTARAPDAAAHLHTDAWYPLVWSYTRPEAMATLVSRSVCFLFQYASLCEHKAQESGTTFEAMLDEIDRAAGSLWRALTESGVSPAACT